MIENYPLAVGGVDDYPVKVGSMLLTMVEPHRGFEQAYNRWYERDHYYAGCMIGPFLYAGSRWVATRELKDLRWPVDSESVAAPIDKGSYVSIYWVEGGHHAEHFDWAGTQVRWLYANNRGFPERTHAHTSNYDFAAVTYRDPDNGVPIELALDHAYQGLGVVFVEPVGETTQQELLDWITEHAAPEFVATAGIDNIGSFVLTPEARDTTVVRPPAPMDLGTDGGNVNRLVQLAFLESEPTRLWDAFRAYAARIDGGGLGKVTFAAPFIPTNVGTDQYTDQLW